MRRDEECVGKRLTVMDGREGMEEEVMLNN